MMKYLIRYLFLAMRMYAVEDEGGGSGGADDEGGEEAGQDTGGSEGAKQEPTQGTKEPEHVTVPREQFEAMQRSFESIENERALGVIESNIKKSTPDFSIASVTEYLQTLAKTDPEKAKRLANTPEAWEAIYKSEIRQTDPQNDYVGRHRNEGKREFDFDKTLDAANNGDAKAFSALFENSVSTNYKQ